MARQIITTLTDDLEPDKEAEGTVAFGIDGKDYEIDLSTDNAKRLRELVAPYVDKARRAGGRVARATGAKMTVTRSRSNDRSREETQAIREWANSVGMSVAERGRIPSEVLEAYANRAAVQTAPRTVVAGAPVFAPAGSTATSSATEPTVQRKAPSGKTRAANPSNGAAATMAELIAFRQAKGLPVGPEETTKGGALKATVAKATREMMSNG